MSDTRLAAIMFTDIVGYTTMMQTDQEQGMAAAKRHESVLQDRLAAHGGELLQTFGDGSLSIFESASAAVRCAKEIQLFLRDSVPLRIGLHLGEITRDGNHNFGDGVNIASRIESMGKAGVVLLSSSIRQQIKNKPEFQLHSLGRFAFKNVAEPMTVYALANEGFPIPKASEIQGKGEKIRENKSNPRTTIRLASIGFVAMAVGALLFWIFGSNQSGDSQLLPQEVRKGKVAVAVFENFTGDEEFNTLGYLASEWISSSLREIGIKTVAPEMVRQYRDYVGILPDNPEGKISFAEITQAAYVVTGSYFQQKDSLRLTTRLLDAVSGNEIQSFPEIWSTLTEKEQLVEEARQRLMGFWAIQQDQHFPKIQPPKYEAYRKFISCTNGHLPCYLAVLALDSTFLLNHANIMHSAVWWTQESHFLSSRDYIERHWDWCTKYEKNFYQFSKEFWLGNDKKATVALNENYLADPQNVNMVHETAYVSSSHLYRPDIAVEKYRKLFENYDTYQAQFWDNVYYHFFASLNRLGHYQEVIDLAASLPQEDWLNKEKVGEKSWFELFLAYLETDQDEMAIEWIETILDQYDQPEIISQASWIWSLVRGNTVFNPFHQKILERIQEYKQISEVSGAEIWDLHNHPLFILDKFQPYFLGNWEKAEINFLSLREVNHDFIKKGEELYTSSVEGIFSLANEAYLGNAYAYQGKKELAMSQFHKLETMRATFPLKHTPHRRGLISYSQARIVAILGEKDKAVALLKRSLDEGRPITWWSYTMDRDLASLRGYEPFVQLVFPFRE